MSLDFSKPGIDLSPVQQQAVADAESKASALHSHLENRERVQGSEVDAITSSLWKDLYKLLPDTHSIAEAFHTLAREDLSEATAFVREHNPSYSDLISVLIFDKEHREQVLEIIQKRTASRQLIQQLFAKTSPEIDTQIGPILDQEHWSLSELAFMLSRCGEEVAKQVWQKFRSANPPDDMLFAILYQNRFDWLSVQVAREALCRDRVSWDLLHMAYVRLRLLSNSPAFADAATTEADLSPIQLSTFEDIDNRYLKKRDEYNAIFDLTEQLRLTRYPTQ